MSSLCDIYITIGKRRLVARLVHLGLLAILTVDSGLLPSLIPIPSISSKEYKVGDSVELIGLNPDHQLVQKRTKISSISALEIPENNIPAWRITNIETYDLFDTPSTSGGVLVDPTDFSLMAFWMEIKYGEDSYGIVGVNYHYYIAPIVEALKSSETIETWSPGCIFGPLHLAKAIDLGMPEHNATQIMEISKSIGTGAHATWVVEKQSQSISDLEIGDFILEIDDEPVGRMADIRRLSQSESVKALVLRDRKEREVIIKSKLSVFKGPPAIVCFGGAILQVTPTFALEQTTSEFLRASKKEKVDNLESLIYVCSILGGSPACEVEGIRPGQWLVEVNKRKVSSVQVLLDIIESLKGRTVDDGYIQMKLIGKRGNVSKVGLKLNSPFWPAWILEFKENEWTRRELE